MSREARPVRVFVIRDRTGIFHPTMYFNAREAESVLAELKQTDRRYAEGYVEALTKETQ